MANLFSKFVYWSFICWHWNCGAWSCVASEHFYNCLADGKWGRGIHKQHVLLPHAWMCWFSLCDCNHTRNKAKSILPSPREQSASSKGPPCLCLHTLESYFWYLLLTKIYLHVQLNMPCLLFMWAFNLSLRVYVAGQREHCIEKAMCFCSMCLDTSHLEARQKPHSRQFQVFRPSSSLLSSSRGSIRASTSTL